MASKTIKHPEFGTVHLYKRRGARHIRLSLTHDGEVRVSQPVWLPYENGLQFLNSQREWVLKNMKRAVVKVFADGDRVGKRHVVRIYRDTSTEVKTRLSDYELRVTLPHGMEVEDEAVQAAIQKAAQKALRQQAEDLLPARIAELAARFGLRYTQLTIRSLRTRWGSCNQRGEITLNFYLMQVPWALIDYVILHELTHLEHLDHSPAFWLALMSKIPEAKQYKKAIKAYQPNFIQPSANES